MYKDFKHKLVVFLLSAGCLGLSIVIGSSFIDYVNTHEVPNYLSYLALITQLLLIILGLSYFIQLWKEINTDD